MTSLRSRLFHGTAVVALALLPNAQVLAQALPQGGVVQGLGVVVGTGTTLTGVGTAALPFNNAGVLANSANNFVVGTGGAGQHAIINWNSFDIGSTGGTNSVNFTGAGGVAFSVLNRVNAGGSPTAIAGTLTGGGNGTIFVINEAGISFANSAQVTNLSGFVASSLDISNSQFNTYAAGSGPLKFTGAGAASVAVAADVGAAKATISPDSVLLLVAPKLDIQGGVLSAASGDAGFVLASDATVALNSTSIISIKIDAGAPIATAQSLIAGTISGKRVLVAAATSADIVGSLLNVTGSLMATTATATDRGIVIAIERNAPIDATNNITFDVANAQFNADLVVSGTLKSSARIDTVGSRLTSIGAAMATGGASFVTRTGLTLGGDIMAGSTLTGSGTSIILGIDGAAHSLKTTGTGAVGLTASGGGAAAITTLGDFSITGGGAVTLESAVGVAANVSQDGSLAITGSKLFVGNIASNPAGTLAGTGDVVLTANGAAASDSLIAGSVVAQGAVTAISNNGDVTLSSATSGNVGAVATPHDVTITAAGVATVSGGVISTGNIAIGGASLILGTDGVARSLMAGATGTVGLTATGGGATAITTLGDFTISGGGAVTVESAVGVAANVSQDGSLTITGSTVSLGNVASAPAGTLAGTGDVVLIANGAASTDALVAGTVVAQGAVTAKSTGGAVTLGGATSGNVGGVPTPHDVTVTAAGLATVSGAVTSTGSYIVKGGSVSLGGAQSAAASVLVKSSTGGIATTGALTADSGGAGGQLLVLDGFGAITGGGSLASGTARQSDILIAAGGDLALGKVDARSLAGALSVAAPAGASAYVATTADTLITANAITLGAVTTTNANTIQSTGTLATHRDVTVGGDTSTGVTGSVEVSATTGDVTLSGAVSAQTTATLHADLGTLTVGSVRAFGGNATLTGGTAIAKTGGAHDIAASGNVGLKSDGAIVVDAVRASGTVIAGGATGLNAASLTGDSLRAGGAVTVNTSGLINLAGVNATSAQSTGSGLDALTLTAFTGGAVGAADVQLLSTGGAVTVNDIASTANIAGSGTTFTLGTVGAAHSLAAAVGAGTVTLTASDTGAAAITVLGNYTISGSGAVALQRSAGVGANVTHDNTLTIGGASVLVGDLALAASLPTLVGTGDVTLTSSAAAGITAGVVVARNAVSATATGGPILLGGATSGSAGDITVIATGGDAEVTGAVKSAGNYRVKGTSVVVGRFGATQAAVGDILIQSNASTFASGTLNADSGGTGGRRLVIDASSGFANSASGPVTLIAGDAAAAAVAGNRSDILITVPSGHALALGSVDANAFSTTAHNAAALVVGTYVADLTGGIPSVVTDAAITSGAIKTIQSIVIGSTGAGVGVRNVTLGGVTSALGSVEAYSTSGDLSLTGPVSAKTFASLHADAGTLTVGDVRAFGGDATLVGATAIAKASGSHAIAALNNVVLQSPGAIKIDAVRAGGTVTVRGSIVPGSSATSLMGTSIAANGKISISTTADINLTGSGLTIDAPRLAINASTLATFDGGSVANADVALTSTGGLVKIGAIEATGNLTINAATTATVSGNAEAGFSGGSGNYHVTGTGVVLGGAGTTQKATGDVWIVATGGGATGGIGATGAIIANDGGTTGARLVLDSAGRIGGVDLGGGTFTPGASLQAGAGIAPTIANRSDILIALGDTAQSVTLGAIDGRSLSLATSGAATVAAYAPVTANQFETAGPVTLGAVQTVLSNVIGSTGTLVGQRDVGVTADNSVTGSVEIRSAAGAVTLSGPVVAATSVNLHADSIGVGPGQGVLTVADVTASSGDATLTGGTGIATVSSANTIAATGNILLASPGSIAIGSAKAGGTITAQGLAPASSAGSLSGVGLQANGAINAKTTGAINLTGTGTAATTTQRKTFAIATGFATGANVADADVMLTGSTVTLADAGSTGNLSVNATGLATVTGTVTVGDSLTGAASGNYSVAGSSITLGGTGVVHSATGGILLASPGAISIDTLRAPGTITIRGATVGSSASSLSGIGLQSNTTIAVSTSGAINLTGTGVSATATRRLRFDPVARTFTVSGPPVALDSDIGLTSTGAGVSIADAASTGSISLTANGLATATGIVTAGDATTGAASGNYTVTGANITLGGAGVVQSATGTILLASPGAIAVDTLRAAGTITARGATVGSSALSFAGIALQSNSDIAVTTSAAIGLTGTGAARSATLRALFDPTLRTFTGATTAADHDIALISTGGTVTVADAATTGNLAIRGLGAVIASGIVAAGDAATLAGSGSYTVTGGSITLGGGIAGQTAVGNILIQSSGAVVETALRSGGTITARGLTTGTNAASLTGDSLQSNGAITVATNGVITLAGVNATSVATQRQKFAPATGLFTGASVADANIALTTVTGTISVHGGSSTGNTTLIAGTGGAAGGVAATGTLTAGDGSTAAGIGDLILTGQDLTSLSNGTATRNITVTSNGNNATIGTVTAGTAAAGGTITARSLVAGGTATIASGTATLGDVRALATAAGGVALITFGQATQGNILADGDASATITTGTTLGAVSTGDVTAHSLSGNATVTTGRARGNIVADALNAALVSDGVSVAADISAISRSTVGGSAMITLADAHNITADAQFGPATIVDAKSLVSGNITATVHTGSNLASIGPGVATVVANGGNVAANQLGTGNATIATASASGNVTATAGALADITSGTAGGSVVASGGTAHIGFGGAGGSVRALAGGGTATVDTGTAATGNVDALATTAATITSGTATLGNVRATSTGGGLAMIASGIAGTSVVATGGSVTIGSATAGDDIIASASTGAVNATKLTITGLGTDTAATDASGTLLTGALTGLGGSNAVIRAATGATIGGSVSIAQATASQTANYDVTAASITLGTAAAALNQSAAGRVDLVSTSGGVTFANTGGALQSNVGGLRTANALADATTAGGGLSITSATGITGTTTNLVANAKTLGAGFDTQARQPGVVLAAAASGGGSVRLASITGGAVTVTAPATIAVPLITATGNVALTGVAVAGNDTATISPTTITIDGLSSGYARVNVTAAGGAGAEVASLGVVNGGQVDALQILANTSLAAPFGAATLRATPSDPTRINSIIVESQTGVAGILAPVSGPATVAARTIVLRGRQAGSSVLATNPLFATGSVTATGPSVTLGTVTVAGTLADGSGDIQIAATGAASLATGAAETATARRTIGLTAGTTATIGAGTATGGALGVRGATVTILRSATAGDDVVLSSSGAINAAGTTIATTGTVDLQGGIDVAPLDFAATTTLAGTGYGAGQTVIADVLTAARDATTGGAITLRGGSNVIATGGGALNFGGATLTATGATARDVRVESNGVITLANTTAARGIYAVSTGDFGSSGTLIAGDDIVIVAGGGINVAAGTLRTVGGALTRADARRADGTLLSSVATVGALTNLGGSNIALDAGGAIQLGAIQTTGAAPSSLRAFSNAAVTTTQAVNTTGSLVLVGATVASPFALTAGDDIVAVARGGTATLSGVLTTTGANASNAALVDLTGTGIALPGEAALGRVDGSSILVAATGLGTVSTTVTSASRYSVYGRSGIALGTAVASGPGTAQSAAGDVLLEASIGAVPVAASVSLANNMVLTSNSDGIEAASGSGFIADPLVVRIGNGSLSASGATLRAGRTATATLADQGTVQVQSVATDGVKSITIATLDSAQADLRALNDVTVTNASVDAGLTLASKAGAVVLTTLTVGTATPLMTPAQVAAIDLKLSAATGATLGNAVTGANLLRDITVATTGGTASITGAAGARDDIVVASTTGAASAGTLSFVGTASDSEAGVATIAATDANGVALADPYQVRGPTITGFAGRNIVVSGATGATLGTVTTAASDGLGDVRVVTAAGPATLTTVSTGGAGLPARVLIATRNGAATGTTINASGDIIVDATLGSATLTTGTAGRDAIVVGPSVTIGSLTVGDDIVAVATAGTLNAGTLTSAGANSGDAIATIFRADGSAIVDPVAGGVVGGLTGGNVIALASGDATVGTATATAAVGATAPGLVRIASRTGTTTVTGATASAGDLLITGATVNATTLSAGRDATVTVGGLATIARLTAGRDVTITAGSASLGTGLGLVAAQRNFLATTSGLLTIGTARAGGTLTATGGSVVATTLGAGDALSVRATAGDATVTTAMSTGRPLLGDFSGFAASGSAAGSTRDIAESATGVATLTTGTAVHSISVAGTTATATTATANTGATDGDLALTGTTGGATLGTGTARDIRVAATGGGGATATTATATRDLYVDASGGTATLVTGIAGRDGIVVGPAVSIGTLTAGDDIVAVANAGTLTAGTLTSTGANSGDSIATIARADGSAIADPVAGGSVGGLTGGNVVALGSGTVGVTTATATAAAGASVPGLVRLASLGGTTTVTTATASAGDIVLGGVAVSGGTVIAGRDAMVTSTGGDIALGSIATTRDFVASSANDIVVAGVSSAGGNATLTAVRDINLGATAVGDALATVGGATLTAGRDIVVAQRTTAGTAIAATAGGAATLNGTLSGTTTTIATQGNLTLTADAVATGALTLTSAAGAITAPNISGNGIALTAANATTVSGAATSTGALTATSGSLSFGGIATTLDATLRATGAIGVTGTTVTGGALTATSDAGAMRTGAVTTGGPATITAADATNGAIVLASLTTTGAATLRAGQSAEVTGAATTSGAFTATAINASLRFGSIAAGGAATLRARTALTVGGLARSGGALDALSSAGALSFGSTQAATTVTLRGATGVAVTGGTTAGGAVAITADTGPIVTGDINAGGDTVVTATGGSATLASVSRTGRLTVAAATDATITGAVTTTGDTLVTATNGSAAIGGAVRTANYTVRANNGTIALGAGVVQASSGTVTLDSQRLTIGAGTALVGSTRIQLDVTGNAAGVSLGDGAGAAAGTTKYALSKADLRKFQTPVFEIAAVARPVDIGDVDLDGVAAVGGGFAGISNALGIRTTGDIRIADRLTFTSAAAATPPRVLTIGGAAGGTDLDKTTTTANSIKVLAVSGLDNSVTGTGGQINAGGSIVQLRATYIALGETPSPVAGRPFIDTLLPASGAPLTTADTRTQFVNNASSTLYLATPPYAKQVPTPQALVKAGTLVLAPGQWALIQNTGPTTTPGGGIEVGTLKFTKVAGAAAADPVIGVFGSVAGKTGIASAISVNAGNLDGISPNNIRVNGCVALSTAGCIQSAVAIPLINLADPGRTLLISSAPDFALSVELITGATNEALWREDDDDCAPGTEKDRCNAQPGQQSPQRESRP